jgi:biopolymer transport protein ExbD
MQFYTKKRKTPIINIISLIDIFCILLIFSLVTTTFKKSEPVVQIDLPESATGKETTEKRVEPVTITATKDLSLTIGGKPITIETLSGMLKEMKPDTPQGFVLKADKGVPLGFFVKILDASKAAGIDNLNLQTDEAKTPPVP